MDEVKKPNGHIISPAAFVEGGIQDSCDDACSICLEVFCDSDPSTVISKYNYTVACYNCYHFLLVKTFESCLVGDKLQA